MYEQQEYQEYQEYPVLPAYNVSTGNARGAATTSFIFLVLAAVMGYSRMIFYMDYDSFFKDLSANLFIVNARWFLCGLVVPLSLALLNSSTRRDTLAKPLLAMPIVFLVVQLLCAVLAVTDLDSDSMLYPIVNAVSGSGLLTCLENLFELLGDGGSFEYLVESLSVAVMATASNVFYILANIMGIVGFSKLKNE